MPFCTQCGHENPDDANFCSRCGARLPTAAADPGTGTDSTSTLAIAREEVEREEGLREDIGDLGPADQAAVDALPAGSALLVVLRGPNAGSRFLLDTDSVSAGRHPDSDIFLDDVTVSRRHVEILRDEHGNYRVRDVGSLNGTYLNRTRVDEAELNDGDELQVGMFKLVFFHGTKR